VCESEACVCNVSKYHRVRRFFSYVLVVCESALGSAFARSQESYTRRLSWSLDPSCIIASLFTIACFDVDLYEVATPTCGEQVHLLWIVTTRRYYLFVCRLSFSQIQIENSWPIQFLAIALISMRSCRGFAGYNFHSRSTSHGIFKRNMKTNKYTVGCELALNKS